MIMLARNSSRSRKGKRSSSGFETKVPSSFWIDETRGIRASSGMTKAKDTVARYAAQAREELALLPEGAGRAALATLVDYTISRHG